MFNCDFDLAGSAVGNMISPTTDASAINTKSLWNHTAESIAHGTYGASSAEDCVVPLSGTWIYQNVNNAEYRNPAILSGIEFCDISGAPNANQFTIFKLDSSNAVKGMENPLINNTVIKCKSVGGLPRLRFDLSAYGDRRNYFIKDHKFKLGIKGLVAEENDSVLGGGQLGVWIHTQPTDGIIWTWTPKQKWEAVKQSRISIPLVTNILSHTYSYGVKMPDAVDREYCLGNINESNQVINNNTLKNLKDKYFEDFTINFDTRNFTIHNNFEYLDIIPISEEDYKKTPQVNTDDTNYIVEIFFVPNENSNKYLLLDSIELQDVTQRDNAAIGTGHGIETSGTPLRKFVKEDKLYLDKNQVVDVLKFYNGLAGLGTGLYATPLASRDSTITSDSLELSGGSRLNYRIHPDWTPNVATATHYLNYTNLELDN